MAFREATTVLVALAILALIFFHPTFRRGHFVPGTEFREGGAIVEAMNAYLGRHGSYPAGKSSTEVFQKLLDDHLVDDPGIFYVPFPGKSKAVSGQRLKPENVSWDMTWSDPQDYSFNLPLVFLTGSKVDYVTGGSAHVLVAALPKDDHQELSWIQWWNHDVLMSSNGALLVVNKSGGGTGYPVDAGKTVPNFIPADFDTHGRSYHQLTPTGIMP